MGVRLQHPFWPDGRMSFDIFFQASSLAGRPKAAAHRCGGASERPFFEEEGTFLGVRVGDGRTDIYLRDSGMMANRISGQDPWDLLV